MYIYIEILLSHSKYHTRPYRNVSLSFDYRSKASYASYLSLGSLLILVPVLNSYSVQGIIPSVFSDLPGHLILVS